MEKNPKIAIIEEYNQELEKYGDNDYRSLCLEPTGQSDFMRYALMEKEAGGFTNKTILDVGCGWAAFIRLGFPYREYLGVDINETLLGIAKGKNYQNAKFECMDIDVLVQDGGWFGKKFDVVLMSALLGELRNKFVQPDFLRKLFGWTLLNGNQVMINFPSVWKSFEKKDNKIEYYVPDHVLGLALQVTQKVKLIHDVDKDFLLVLEK